MVMFRNTHDSTHGKCMLYGIEILGFAGGVVFLLFALWYSISNASGHTGINIYWVSLSRCRFSPTFFMGAERFSSHAQSVSCFLLLSLGCLAVCSLWCGT